MRHKLETFKMKVELAEQEQRLASGGHAEAAAATQKEGTVGESSEGRHPDQEEAFEAAVHAITNALQGQGISAANARTRAEGSGQCVALPTTTQQAMAGPRAFSQLSLPGIMHEAAKHFPGSAAGAPALCPQVASASQVGIAPVAGINAAAEAGSMASKQQ